MLHLTNSRPDKRGAPSFGLRTINFNAFELPNQGFVAVKVYGLTGRLVKVLLSGSQAAGTQSVPWDGTDFNGNPVAAGIYIYQIEFTGVDGKKYTLSKKMSLVR
jgi:flagellar hook assembly protein FlgD